MKTIVITGASDGIGAEMARQLAQRHGAAVALVLAARNEEALHAVAAQCPQLLQRRLVFDASGDDRKPQLVRTGSTGGGGALPALTCHSAYRLIM